MPVNNFLYDTNVPGVYIFRITDNQGCTAESSPITLNPPQNIDAAATTTIPASCGLTNNGVVNIIPDATSGIPPYEISFNGGAFGSQSVFSNLNAGQTYPYLVRDARGCETLPASITIATSAILPPDAIVSPILATCTTGAVEGGINITSVTDGQADYTFILQDQFGVEIDRIGPTATLPQSFSNVIPGDYTVVTLDAFGCRDEDPVTVIQSSLTVVPDPVLLPTCNVLGFSNTVEIVGGVGPNFLIRLATDPNPPVTPNAPPRRHTFNGLQFGVAYTVEVTDVGTGCVYLQLIPPITGPTTLDVTATSIPGHCDLNRNGRIDYDVTGFAANSNLLIEILHEDGTRNTIANPINVSPTYSNFTEIVAGNYQIIVTDLTDNCTAATAITIEQNLPSINIISEQPANCNAFGQITVQGSGGVAPYTYAITTLGAPEPLPAAYSSETTFVAAAGNYDIYVKDSNGCTSFGIGRIINLDPDLPTPDILVNNQCDITATTFQIQISMPAAINTPRFTMGGVTILTNPAIFTVNSPGDYIVDVIDANGCTSQGTATVYEFLSASGDFSTIPSCNVADGEITISTTGGSNDFTYLLTGTNYLGAPVTISQLNDAVFTTMLPGNYQVLVTDNLVVDVTGNCTSLVNDIILLEAVLPVIDIVNKQDISCNGANDGSIDVSLVAGTDADAPISYRLLNFDTRALITANGSGSFTGLVPGRYDVEVLTARNCSVTTGLLEVVVPLVFSIDANAPDFTCEPGANRFSATTVTVSIINPGTAIGGYEYSITGFNNYQSSNTFEIVDNGFAQTITVYAIDGNGCRDQITLPTLNPPTDVVSSISVLDVLNCAAPERVRIDVVGSTNFTVETNSGPVAIANVNNTGVNTFVEIDLPVAGGYLFELVDHIGGCRYPLPLHTVVDPISPIVLITEAKPVSCAVPGTDGELFIEVTDYTGVYNYNVYQLDTNGNRLPSIATGSFDTANFPDPSGDPARITGLPGGNFVVDITTIANPQCPGTSNVTTITAPNGVLVPTAVEIGNVSCSNDTGRIEASLTGGWDTVAYEYRLIEDSPAATEIVGWSTTNLFQNLSSGDYTVEYRDVEGCTTSLDITLAPLDPILVEIREPQELVCPGGNNAILEAYDPASGTAITGTSGASGGVAGAGYKYQLIYLGSNSLADEVSRSGLQDSPTFQGAAGVGYISAGWYAIEVSSSFNCIGQTMPYFVSPPPAIIPNLVQVLAPGCGGMGEMRLSVENPEIGFEYEYKQTSPVLALVFTAMGVGNSSVLISGAPGFYQFEIRKINILNTCDAVVSNGLTLIDAQNLDLVVTSIDEISCASELDGRIESFASGGIGANEFTLYQGDPGNPFAPNASATLVSGPQDHGTFEGLPQGTEYYIAVKSGISCSDVEGPFEIVRPEAIVFTTDPSPITCNGENDGSVLITVQSGGEGLVQFAISPNFNDFFSDPANPGVFLFDELDNGDYEILIQDEKGCSEKRIITISEPDVLVGTIVNTIPETCLNDDDGSAQISIAGGTPFLDINTGERYYETKFIRPNSDGSEVFARDDLLLFQNLSGGETYVVFIRDAQGCETNIIFPIDIGVNLAATTQIEYGCNGIFPFSTTTINLEDTSVLNGLLFSLDEDDVNVATEERVFADLPAGDHTVYMYHPNGCNAEVSFNIEAYDPLILVVEKNGSKRNDRYCNRWVWSL